MLRDCGYTGAFFFILSTYIDKSKKTAAKIAAFWCWCLVKVAGVKIKVKNEQILKQYPQYVIVSNHQSYFDIFVLIVVLKKIPHFLAKKELFRIPIFGQALRVADVIEIDRENPDKALESIKKALDKGLPYPICIYPEGTRSPDGNLQPFRKRGLFFAYGCWLALCARSFSRNEGCYAERFFEGTSRDGMHGGWWACIYS